jgi:hypothetical protein
MPGQYPPPNRNRPKNQNFSVNEMSGNRTSVDLRRHRHRAASDQQGGTALADVCFEAHYGLKSDIALSPKSANTGLMRRSRGSNYSITSSALTKMEVGIDKPSNFAVRALTINSWVVGSSMGMSPGLVPFRILSMKYPYR